MKKTNKKGAMRTDQSTAKAPKMSPYEDYNYNNTKKIVLSSVEPYHTILNLIRKGEGNAVHLVTLINGTGLREREVRRCIEQLRRNGSVIASSRNGYYIPDSVYEVKKYIVQETRRAKSIFHTIENAKKLLHSLEE